MGLWGSVVWAIGVFWLEWGGYILGPKCEIGGMGPMTRAINFSKSQKIFARVKIIVSSTNQKR